MLHGDIRVNGILIGEWTAVRQNNTQKDFNDYRCEINFRDVQGYPCHAEWHMTGHRYGDGAVMLAARVLSEGMAKARRTRPTGAI